MENRETGKVVEITNEGTAMVLIQRKKMCDHCPSKEVCKPPEEGKEFTVEIENPIGAKEGDVVEIGIPKGALLIASLWAYLVPSIFFVVGVTIGFTFLSRYITLIQKEFIGLITGIILLAVSYMILRIVNNRIGNKKAFHPIIVSVCSDDSAQ